MKKILNLVIATSRTEEPYEVYLKFAKEMETEIIDQIKNGNSIAEFAFTINNPIGIKKKFKSSKSNIILLQNVFILFTAKKRKALTCTARYSCNV